jgi:hypothetical protein
MKPQRYPATIIKTGVVLYSATAWTDDTGKGHVDIDEWHVRSIQKRAVSKYSVTKNTVISLVEKKEYITWDKNKWLSNIPPSCRRKFFENNPLPRGIYTTPLQALRYALESALLSVMWYEDKKTSGEWDALLEKEYREELKLAQLVKSRITRTKKGQKKQRNADTIAIN